MSPSFTVNTLKRQHDRGREKIRLLTGSMILGENSTKERVPSHRSLKMKTTSVNLKRDEEMLGLKKKSVFY